MTTEERNPRTKSLDALNTRQILEAINDEDAGVPAAVRTAIPAIGSIVDIAADAIRSGGRVIYVGAGTSGRLGMLDAAECPPTFSTPRDWFTGVLAGGTAALVDAVEGVEDSEAAGALEMDRLLVGERDFVIGLAASGRTPYTIAAVQRAAARGARTAAVVSVENSALENAAGLTARILTGPEVVAGSTRMKAGTAQKLALNMISTATMVRLGMVYGNLMVNVAMSNQKLRDRGRRILMEITGCGTDVAEDLIHRAGGQLRVAVVMGKLGIPREEAETRLAESGMSVRRVLGDA